MAGQAQVAADGGAYPGPVEGLQGFSSFVCAAFQLPLPPVLACIERSVWRSTSKKSRSRTFRGVPRPLGGIFDYAGSAERLEEVSRELESPTIWDDPEKAQSLGRERVKLEALVSSLDRLSGGLQDADDLLEMAVEEQDQGTVDELIADLDAIESEISGLEFRRMFCGEMDASSAFRGYPGRLRWYRGPGLGGDVAKNVFALGRGPGL